MDLKGSLINTKLRIYPSNILINYLKTLPVNDDTPTNILTLLRGKDTKTKLNENQIKQVHIHLTNEDNEFLNKVKNIVKASNTDDEIVETGINVSDEKDVCTEDSKEQNDEKCTEHEEKKSKESLNDDSEENIKNENEMPTERLDPYLTTSDIDWLYTHLQSRKSKCEKDVPYLHVLLEGAVIETPKNEVIKRNPVLEARCVKLRAQQEAREYRKMTKTVDNVRMRFPEDSISYQMKQLNRQLIAIGQFILSIFAGFMFGFRGVEWMVGNLDFGFRLLLGVMCALVIALAEIYFLAKKLNEELSIPETVQLGGPAKFGNEPHNNMRNDKISNKLNDKEHQD